LNHTSHTSFAEGDNGILLGGVESNKEASSPDSINQAQLAERIGGILHRLLKINEKADSPDNAYHTPLAERESSSSPFPAALVQEGRPQNPSRSPDLLSSQPLRWLH
jgi:hypothetical protein